MCMRMCAVCVCVCVCVCTSPLEGRAETGRGSPLGKRGKGRVRGRLDRGSVGQWDNWGWAGTDWAEWRAWSCWGRIGLLFPACPSSITKFPH